MDRESHSSPAAPSTLTEVRLTPRPPAATPSYTWPAPITALLKGEVTGPLRVLGGPGSGKTTLIVELAAARIRAGQSPAQLRILTHSKAAATALRDDLVAAVVDDTDFATTGPLVYSIHAMAFAILSRHAHRHQLATPHLLTGAEHDATMRDILRAQAAVHDRMWPENLQAALPTVGFAQLLRDFLLRTQERQLSPADLRQQAAAHERPEWAAIADFSELLDQVARLQAAGRAQATPGQPVAVPLSAAQLIGAAIDVLHADPDLHTQLREEVTLLAVDDVQHIDAQAAELIALLHPTRGQVVVTGDRDQLVFSFRGATAALLDDPQFTTLTLPGTHRFGATLATYAAAQARRLSGHNPLHGETLPAAADRPDGALTVALSPTESARDQIVVDLLRRQHLLHGVGYSQMAVVVRSGGQQAGSLRRRLLDAGVPVSSPAADIELRHQRGVVTLLHVLDHITRAMDEQAAQQLFFSDLVGGDEIALRRITRRVTHLVRTAAATEQPLVAELPTLRPAELITALIDGQLGDPRTESVARQLLSQLMPSDAERLTKAATMLQSGRTTHTAGGGVEDVLWAIWSAAEMAQRWVEASLRGGVAGAMADRDLDAVMALFDLAGDFAAAHPAASSAAFRAEFDAIQVPTTARDRRRITPDAVSILSAQAVVGRQFHTVVIVDTPDGVWPAAGTPRTLLGIEDLIESLDTHTGDGALSPSLQAMISARARVDAERRMFYAALTRATDRVHIAGLDLTGTSTPEEIHTPSLFIRELLTAHPECLIIPADPLRPEVITLIEHVAHLRRLIEGDTTPAKQREWAAVQLIRLLTSDIGEALPPGTAPDSWWGTQEISGTSVVLPSDQEPLRLSPSSLEMLLSCPLHWVMNRADTGEQGTPAQINGLLIHTVAEGAAAGIELSQMRQILLQAVAERWGDTLEARQRTQTVSALLDHLEEFFGMSYGGETLLGAEVKVSVDLPNLGRPVRLTGRIDRLQRTSDNLLRIVDFKTGNKPNKATTTPQIQAYELALAHGQLEVDDAGTAAITTRTEGAPLTTDAAVLYYLKQEAAKAPTRALVCEPMTSELLSEFQETVAAAVDSLSGETITARTGKSCSYCPISASCPAYDQSVGPVTYQRRTPQPVVLTAAPVEN